MKTAKALVLTLLFASLLAAGCINPPPAPTPVTTATPTAMPTLTVTPGPPTPTLPLSPVHMPNETTNGRTYPNSTIPAITNGSQQDGQIIGEIGRQ